MTILNQRRRELTGRILSGEEAGLLKSSLSVPSARLIRLMQEYPLIGMSFTLPVEEDLSGLGAEFKWLAPEDIIGESSGFYPGLAAVRLGYVPVGSCLRGSGDPYFVKPSIDDPPLVRVPHDCLLQDLSLPEARVERVRNTLSDFFRAARFG